jgi:hypothetical protein
MATQVTVADTLPWNIPQPIRPAIDAPAFKTAFEIGTWLNPFYLRGDFDGDGAVDYAILIKRRNDGKKGIAVWLSGNPGGRMIVLGAGTKARAGAGAIDDWDFFDSWQVYGKRTVLRGAGEGRPPKLIGEAILVERTESASGLVYWDGRQFRWYQQGE